MKTIAIIGSGGTNARPWIDAFLAAGWWVRNLVRNLSEVTPRERLAAVAFDFDDQRSHEPAIAGVDVLALISPARPEQVAWESALIGAAQHVGVGGVIKLSVIGADLKEPISFFARNAAQAEEALRRSGVPHVILRSSGFMQNVLRQRASIEAGSLTDPLGATAASHVDVHDIADVAVAVANGPFDGRALTLTGPAALTGAEMAATLSDVLGRPVHHILPSAARLREALTGRGMPAWQIDAFIELQEAVLTGRAPHLALVTADIEATTGKPPRSFAQFARREFAPSASLDGPIIPDERAAPRWT
jgi:uncharacterized protein YbjT (DUF2867 family)